MKKAKKSAPAKKKTAPKSPAKQVKTPKTVARKQAPTKSKTVAKKRPAVQAKIAVKGRGLGKGKPSVKGKPLVRGPASPSRSPAVSRPVPTLPSSGAGTRENPWVLKTPPGNAEFTAYRDETSNPPALVVKVGSTELRYHLRCLEDLQTMLKAHGDWMLLGSADEQQPVVEGTVEAWARSPGNPVGGWYGLQPGLRGRFATYIPPVLEALGLVELEHFPNNNRMRAKNS